MLLSLMYSYASFTRLLNTEIKIHDNINHPNAINPKNPMTVRYFFKLFLQFALNKIPIITKYLNNVLF